jgi:capsular polysaccharide biosynthesis protein
MTNQQLIDAYVQLLSSSSVVDEASRRLNYEINLKDLGSVLQVRSTNVIEIKMDDSDPQRAAAIPNMLVQVLIDKNTQASGYASTEENIKKSITRLKTKLQFFKPTNQILMKNFSHQQVNDHYNLAGSDWKLS